MLQNRIFPKIHIELSYSHSMSFLYRVCSVYTLQTQDAQFEDVSSDTILSLDSSSVWKEGRVRIQKRFWERPVVQNDG